jgi:hypothetical protein
MSETKDFGREAINEIMSCMNDGDPVGALPPLFFASRLTSHVRRW